MEAFEVLEKKESGRYALEGVIYAESLEDAQDKLKSECGEMGLDLENLKLRRKTK